MATTKVDMKQLLEAGAHFGHKTSRWHPKMAPYIHSKRGEIHIINLEKTVEAIENLLPEVEKIAKSGKKILFVGTKKQLKDIVKTAAESVDMPYVTVRWMGGMLTNTETMSKQIKKLANLEKRMESGELARRYNKLEVQRIQEEIEAMNEKYSGIREMREQPALVIVTDMVQDKNAIAEAKTLGIPVAAIADTNVNPEQIDFIIPANDDAIAGVNLILNYITDTIKKAKK